MQVNEDVAHKWLWPSFLLRMDKVGMDILVYYPFPSVSSSITSFELEQPKNYLKSKTASTGVVLKLVMPSIQET